MPFDASELLAAKAEFHAALHEWYRTHARILPWRHEPSLYKTVVSEFMLQQTQVKTVLPYFARWLVAFPTFEALAAAPERLVLKHWEGLGYYHRARNLQRLAKALIALPMPPRTPAEWQRLPGVGPYTAAAVTSIAFGTRAACVDGNVVRILARLTADPTTYRDSSAAARALKDVADALVPETGAGDHNQAMMELGAVVCLRQNPLCLTCPVRFFCRAARNGEQENYPKLQPKVIEMRAVDRVWCERNDSLLLHRGAANARRLADIHELPLAEHIRFEPQAEGSFLARKRRAITRFQITETIWAAPAPRAEPGPGLVWVPLKRLSRIVLSGPHRRWIREILESRAQTAK